METHINSNGFLDVRDGHQIYWEDWGNPQSKPIIHLHGGPGAGFSDSHKQIYDPTIHRVIFHDQRGCGKSTPFGSTDSNTTQNLINDIELLRKHLGIQGKVPVAGGSWGSALALLYAIAHPESVSKLMIWSVYTVRKIENAGVTEGYAKTFFPEAWDRFISLVPSDKRHNADDILGYYHHMMRSDDPREVRKYALEWSLWESNLVTLDYDPEVIKQNVYNDDNMLAVALLETHYFINGCFVDEGYVYSNLDKIKHIPCLAIQGRFDVLTLPYTAYHLSQSYGDNFNLRWVNSGHIRTDPEMMRALQATARAELV